MKARAILLSIAFPALFAVSLFAQAPQKPAVQKSEIQIRAEALMERARHLSDIRAKNAPAFRLKATFSFVGKDLENTQGTYTEVWVSTSQWWRETVVNNLRRVEVGGTNRRWLLDNTQDFPDTAARLPALMKLFPSATLRFDFQSVVDSTKEMTSSECAITKPGSSGDKYAFCFEKKTGALLEKVSPEIRPTNAVRYSCFYGMFRKFGEFWFPREMGCFEDKHRKLETKVVDISAEPSPDTELFKPPPGATERAECLGTSVPPSPVSAPGPLRPLGGEDRHAQVLLSLIVDRNGKPQDLRVRRSAGTDFGQRALDAVRRWKFKPGTCDGEPIPMEINVETDF